MRDRLQTRKVTFQGVSRLRSGLSIHLCGLLFESQGAVAALRRVAAARIVEAVDKLEDRAFCVTACVPMVAPDQLSLDGVEESEGVRKGPSGAFPRRKTMELS